MMDIVERVARAIATEIEKQVEADHGFMAADDLSDVAIDAHINLLAIVAAAIAAVREADREAGLVLMAADYTETLLHEAFGSDGGQPSD